MVLQSRRMVDFDHPDYGQPKTFAESRRTQTNAEDDEDNIPGPCDAFIYAWSKNRVFGMGFCGRLFDNDLDPSKKNKYDDLLKSIKQHRAYFTYWYIITSQLSLSLSLYLD